MFIYRLAEPIDLFDGLTPLPEWLRHASPDATCWAMEALFALADAAARIGWRGDMRHLPAVGALLTPPMTTPFLVIKQDDNGTTFVITNAETPWLADNIAATAQVASRRIGAWTPPTSDDLVPPDAEPAQLRSDPAAAPF